MDGESYGGVSGEVMKQHLTIGKADKQGDLAYFGEVCPFFLQNFFRERDHLPGIVCKVVADVS